jgi:PAS domain S-box-containing protein
MDINIRTFAFIIGITHIIQFIVIYYQYRINKIYKGIGWWLLWSGTEVLGFLAIVIRGQDFTNPIIIIVQNSLIISGTIFVYTGIMAFFGKKINWKAVILIFTAFILFLSYFTFIDFNILYRTGTINATLTVISFFTAYNLYKHKFRSVSSSANFIIFVLLIHGITFMFLTIMTLFVNQGYEAYSSNYVNIIQYTDAFMAGLLWAFGFIIMINQRLNAENKEERDELELIYNSSPDSVLITSFTEGIFEKVNDGFTSITGYKQEDVLGKSTLEINLWINPNDRNIFVKELKEKGILENKEFEFKRKDGSVFTGMLSARIIHINEIQYILSVTRDVSERKKVEMILKESEDRLTRAEKAAKIGNWKIMLDTKELISSAGARIIYGVDGDILTLDDVQLIPLPEYRKILDDALTDLITKDIPYNVEFKIKRLNDGKILDIHSIAEYDKINKVMYGVIHNITEQKRTEEKLRESEEKLLAIISAANVGITVTDRTGKFLIFSDWWSKNLGYNVEELGNLTNIELTHPDDRETSEQWLQKIFNKETDNYRIEKRFIRKDGSIFWGDLAVSALKDENNNVINLIGMVTDITERINAEAEIKLQNEQLHKLNSEKDKFFSIIAHDLRSPFNGFLGLTELMVTDLHNMTLDDINRIAGLLNKSSKNLYRLLTNLLEWSLMQRGSITFNPERLSLKNITDDSLKIFVETAKRKNIEIEENIGQDIFVNADKSMLETIIRNLVSNAIKFSDAGGQVSISASKLNGSTEISVTDSGIGMSKDLIDNLFKIDKQTTRKGTENEPSTGLGLLLCKEFAEKHGGNILLESETGKGSKFTIFLPSDALIGKSKMQNTRAI